MRKLFKSIAIYALIAAVLGYSNISVVAAEHIQKVENVESSEEVQPRRTMVASFSSSQILTKGKILGTVYFGSSVQSIDWVVPGTGGNVIFKMTNQNTGEVRTFTTTGNGILSGITYNTAMSAGTWEIKVHFVSGTHSGVNMWFYY